MRRVFTSYLPAIALGLFLARCLYELDPLRLMFLGDWPGVIALTVACLLITRHSPLPTSHSPLPTSHSPLPTSRFPRITLIPLLLLLVYVVWPEVDQRWALVLLIGSLALMGHDIILSYSTRWFDLVLTVSVLVLYLLTLGTRVGRADTFEFQVVAPQLGIAHPTGYPLFIVMGKVFSLLPFGSMAFRVNLLSALCATGAALVIYRLIVALTSDRLAAAIAALALAASSVFWSQAVVVEVYTLNALFVAIILARLIRLMVDRSLDNRSTLYSLALVFGLAISHHLTSVILIPPMMLALAACRRSSLAPRGRRAQGPMLQGLSDRLLARPKLPRKAWSIALGLFLIGLTPWLYLPLRWPGLHNGATLPIAEWLGWIFGQRFGGALNLSLWSDPTRWGIISRIALDQFGLIGALLAAFGLIVLIKRSWRVALITFAAFAGYWFYGLVYNVPDIHVFIIPAFSIMAIWIGVALEALARRVSPLRVAYYALFALLPLTLIAANYAAADERERDVNLENWGRFVLSLPIPANAAILADSEKIAPLYYLQVTEGVRPDLAILVLGDEALYRQELDRRLGAGQAVYLARFLPNLPYRLRSLGPLVEVSREPLTIAPALDRVLNADFDGRIKLIGVTAQLQAAPRLTLIWQAVSAERPNYHVRLRLIDAAGQIWWADQGAPPVAGYYPTGAWAPGEIVPDFHEMTLESCVPAGPYNLEVGLFVPFRDEALKVNGADWFSVAQVQVSPRAASSLARAVRIVSGERVITSVEALGDVPPASEAALRVTADGPESKAVLALWPEATVALSTPQVVRAGESRLMFRAPDLNGAYALRLKFDTPSRCRWLAPLTEACAIGAINVAGEAIGDAINFDNQVLLMTSAVDRTSLPPGETIKIDLTWRGLKPWRADYTVFAHLVGPDGKVHGQIDQWPVQGTLPTSSWSAGQMVNDPYAVRLPPDAPRGTYQVEVGWYLLATLRRLSVLDAAGRPSDDKVIIGEFSVP